MDYHIQYNTFYRQSSAQNPSIDLLEGWGGCVLLVMTYMATIEHLFSGFCPNRRWWQFRTI